MVKRPDSAAKARRQLERDYAARQTVHERSGRRRIRDNVVFGIAAIAIAGLAGGAQFGYFNGGPGTPTAAPTSTSTPDATVSGSANIGDVPAPELAEARAWTGTLRINDIDLAIRLDGDLAPQATAVLVQAATDDYYSGLTCHRLVAADAAQLLQCGSLDGAGSSETDFAYGPLENVPALGVYPAGTIAMARQSDNGWSQGHQFFIVTAETTLPSDTAGGYTVVGEVTGGLQALIDGIMAAGTADGSQDGQPAVAAVITGFTIS